MINMLCPCDSICAWAGEFLFQLEILVDGKTTVYTVHQESKVTQPESNLLDITFSDVDILLNENICDNPFPIKDIIFEMTIN